MILRLSVITWCGNNVTDENVLQIQTMKGNGCGFKPVRDGLVSIFL